MHICICKKKKIEECDTAGAIGLSEPRCARTLVGLFYLYIGLFYLYIGLFYL